ncbi:MAG: cardiolipin synthase ClsB [Pseudomonas sp.]
MNHQWREGNQVELLINGEDFFTRVFERVRAARHEVLIETFIIFEDRVGQQLQRELIAAAERGVRIELTVDGYGTADLSGEFVAAMVQAGINVHLFDPSPKRLGMRLNLFRRLHRKVVVVDGEWALIGGINYSADHLTDSGATSKQDYAVEVRGPVVADIHHSSFSVLRPAQLQRSQLQPVVRHVGQVRMLLAVRDNNRHTTDIEQEYLRAIRSATTRIVLANAYFFPGYRLLREIRNAARRGVKVTLILQGQADMPWVRGFSRLLYNYLLRDGVVIQEYCQRHLHGKVALIDSEWSTVGSSNLDPLSLALNLEANLIIRDSAFNQGLYEHLSSLASEHCKRISQERIIRGYWWRAPLIFLCFHFLRRVPAIAGWLPAHAPNLQSFTPGNIEESENSCFQSGKVP